MFYEVSDIVCKLFVLEQMCTFILIVIYCTLSFFFAAYSTPISAPKSLYYGVACSVHPFTSVLLFISFFLLFVSTPLIMHSLQTLL